MHGQQESRFCEFDVGNQPRPRNSRSIYRLHFASVKVPEYGSVVGSTSTFAKVAVVCITGRQSCKFLYHGPERPVNLVPDLFQQPEIYKFCKLNIWGGLT